jgi:murein DD-endopeptidase MepM/ murein hydrolase activator NlpD
MKSGQLGRLGLALAIATGISTACGGSDNRPGAAGTSGAGATGGMDASSGSGGAGGSSGEKASGGAGGSGGADRPDGAVDGTAGSGGTGGDGENCEPAAGDAVTTSVPVTGATVALPGVATLVVPAAAFPADRAVRLEKIACARAVQAFTDSTPAFQPGTVLGHQIRVNTGSSQPAAPVELSVQVPAGFSAPAGSQIEVFAQIAEYGELDSFDHFELIDAQVNPAGNVLTVALPRWAFSSSRRSDATFEAIVTLAPSPGVTVRPAGPTRQLSSEGKILPPLKTLIVNDQFGTRTHPITRDVRMHFGTDFEAKGSVTPTLVDGDPIFAVGDGVVQTAFHCSPLPIQGNTRPTGCEVSFGNFVVLKTNASGSATYGHLQRFFVEPGDKLLAGQEIGVTDHTGGSTGPHLHFELTGTGVGVKGKIDPLPRIEARPLVWALEAIATYTSNSLTDRSEWELKMRAEALLLGTSVDPYTMRLDITSGTLFVLSYTGKVDAVSEVCTYDFSPVAYPIIMNDGMSVPTEGQSFGTFELRREGRKGYGVHLAAGTMQNPLYTLVCSQGSEKKPLYLANHPWLADPPNVIYLDPEVNPNSGSATAEQTLPTGKATRTYEWTLTRKY